MRRGPRHADQKASKAEEAGETTQAGKAKEAGSAWYFPGRTWPR